MTQDERANIIVILLSLTIVFTILLIVMNYRSIKKLQQEYTDKKVQSLNRRGKTIMLSNLLILIGFIVLNLSAVPEMIQQLIYLISVLIGLSELASGLFGLVASDLMLIGRLKWRQMRQVTTSFNGVIFISIILIVTSSIHYGLNFIRIMIAR
mgnify:FL=1